MQGETSPRAAESLLVAYMRCGHVRRGLYYVPPPPVPPHGIPLNPYAVAATMTPDTVLSHHMALDFHGCSHAVWCLIQYTAVRPSRPVPFSPCLCYGTRTLVALLRVQAADFSVVEGEMDAAAVQASGLARMLVDVLDRPDLGGGNHHSHCAPQLQIHVGQSNEVRSETNIAMSGHTTKTFAQNPESLCHGLLFFCTGAESGKRGNRNVAVAAFMVGRSCNWRSVLIWHWA